MAERRRDDGLVQVDRTTLHARALFVVMTLTACQAAPSPTPTQLRLATQTLSPHDLAATGTAGPRKLPTPPLSPSAGPTAVASPRPTRPPAAGILTFPPTPGDAGNWFMWAGDRITITWEEAPPDAERYLCFFEPEEQGPTVELGEDLDPSDGVSVQYTLPEHLAGMFDAVAYFANGSEIHPLFSGMVYTGVAPPVGICSMSSRTIGVVSLYAAPDPESAEVSDLYPGEYAEVLGRTADGWYLVDASQTHHREYYEQTPEFDEPPESGWVGPHPFSLHGPCNDLPLIRP